MSASFRVGSQFVAFTLLWIAAADRGAAEPPGTTYDAAPGAIAIYEYHAGVYQSVPLPIDAALHFSDSLPATLTATFYKPIIGAKSDGTPIYSIASIIPLAVTGASTNGEDFSGYLIPGTQYMFAWHFEPVAGGGLVWNGTVGWAGGRYEETTITNVPIIPVPDIQAGDYDADGDVDGHDYLQWQTLLSSTVAPRGSGADGDRDGDVDADDLALWRVYFGASPDAASSTVPEPAAALLAAIVFISPRNRLPGR